MLMCEWCGDPIETRLGHMEECYVYLKIQSGGQEDLLPERHDTLQMGKAPGDWEMEEKMKWGHPIDFHQDYDMA